MSGSWRLERGSMDPKQCGLLPVAEAFLALLGKISAGCDSWQHACGATLKASRHCTRCSIVILWAELWQVYLEVAYILSRASVKTCRRMFSGLGGGVMRLRLAPKADRRIQTWLVGG